MKAGRTLLKRLMDGKTSEDGVIRPRGYIKSGVVFMEIFQMPIKENSVAASPNHGLTIFP